MAGSYPSTLSVYSLAYTPSAPAVTPTQIGGTVSGTNISGVAVDVSNNVYYLAAENTAPFSAATLWTCPAPASPGSYVCSNQNSNGSLSSGQLLAVDALGNGYATYSSPTSSDTAIGAVVKFALATGLQSYSVVYTTETLTTQVNVNFYGLAVSPDGTMLYVAYGTTNGFYGTGVHVHQCASPSVNPCTGSASNDVTASLIAAASPAFTALSGALAFGGPNASLYVGGANEFGESTPPSNTIPVVLVCSSVTVATSSCQVGSHAYAEVSALSTFAQASAVAADPSGNAYAGVTLVDWGSTLPAPLLNFLAYEPPITGGSMLTPYTCGGSTCAIDMLPAPQVLTSPPGSTSFPPPYSMAITPGPP